FISTDVAEKFSLGKTLEFCREQGAVFADYYFSGKTHAKNLKALGFADCSHGAHAVLPTRLNPVVAGGKTFINFVATTSGAKQYNKAKNIKHWYTTKGGGDQDRAY
ncbi:MAG: hypothetical protein U1C18_02840, partial [Patescibacteria group bacterium]|nr:hypothetical protein [Patescibacteria group bacterium]